FVSRGDIGSWFFSCVVSSVRKLLKFEPKPVTSVDFGVWVAVAAVELAPIELTVAVVVMAWAPSDPQIEQAGVDAVGGGPADARHPGGLVIRGVAGDAQRTRLGLLLLLLEEARVGLGVAAAQIEAEAAGIG